MDTKRGALRQVSFLDKEVAQWLEPARAKENGLCLKRFHSDYIAEGVSAWKEGDVVKIEEHLYEITIQGKKCFPECRLLQEIGEPCPLKDGVAFGKRMEMKE